MHVKQEATAGDVWLSCSLLQSLDLSDISLLPVKQYFNLMCEIRGCYILTMSDQFYCLLRFYPSYSVYCSQMNDGLDGTFFISFSRNKIIFCLVILSRGTHGFHVCVITARVVSMMCPGVSTVAHG